MDVTVLDKGGLPTPWQQWCRKRARILRQMTELVSNLTEPSALSEADRKEMIATLREGVEIINKADNAERNAENARIAARGGWRD